MEQSEKTAIPIPGVITPELLQALSGSRKEVPMGEESISLVIGGAYLFAVESAVDRNQYTGIFNHILLTGRVMNYLAPLVKEKVRGFENIDPKLAVQAALIHDIMKVFGETREKLTSEQKRRVRLSENYREIMPEVDKVGIRWLHKLGFPSEVYNVIQGHDFPQEVVDDPYWKLVLIADYMTSQTVMPVDDRLQDIKTRWITNPITQRKQPRMEPKRFDRAVEVTNEVAQEIFGGIGMTDVQFIEKFKLNSDEAMPKWEQFIRRQREKNNQNAGKRRDREKRTIQVLEMLQRLAKPS